MATTRNKTIVGVFTNREQAQKAVNELKRSGFRDDQIGIAARDTGATSQSGEGADDDDTYAGEGAVTGLATGAGVGALWGLGILAGVLPAIGPAIAGGALAALLSSAAAGAAAAGLAGTLVGLGIPKDEAEFYENEFKAGRVVVTVTADGQEARAMSILRQFGGYDISTRGEGTSTSSHSGMTSAASGMASSAAGMTGMAGSTHRTDEACETGMKGQHTHSSTMAEGGKTVKAYEEQLNVRKTPSKEGEVHVRKEVHTEHKTLEVPVTREEIVVERHAGSGQPATGANIGREEDIRVPIREEQVHVEKTPVVAEEVTIGKRKVQDTERVEGTVRKEEIKVEKDGHTNVRDTNR